MEQNAAHRQSKRFDLLEPRTREDFGYLMRCFAARRSLPQEDIAEHLKVNRSIISHYFNGQNLPNQDQLQSLLAWDAMGLSDAEKEEMRSAWITVHPELTAVRSANDILHGYMKARTMPRTDAEFGDWLSLFAERAGLTQGEVGTALHIGRMMINHYFSGNRPISGERLDALLTAVKASPAERAWMQEAHSAIGASTVDAREAALMVHAYLDEHSDPVAALEDKVDPLDNAKFGYLMRCFAARRGLSREEIGAAMGVEPTAISNYFSGKIPPDKSLTSYLDVVNADDKETAWMNRAAALLRERQLRAMPDRSDDDDRER
ncbi:MAG: helix-turn-helix domain-containing protein [Alphaproteobacteria bacterium]